MYRPGTDPDNVQMSDVLCDYCRREWTETIPFVEGHQGCAICGDCLAAAVAALATGGTPTAPADYACRLCREGPGDRAALDREGEPGWQGPVDPEAAACRRCVRQAAGALKHDPDSDWPPGGSA